MHTPIGRLDRTPWGGVVVFTLVACGFAWLVALPLWMIDAQSGMYSVLFGLLAQVMMFTPAIAMLVVVFIMKIPGTRRTRFLGMWPLKPAKRVVWFMVLATITPLLIVALITGVSAVLNLVELDLLHFQGFKNILEEQLAGSEGAASSLPPIEILVMTQILSIPFAAILNSLFAFGEEIGWRGWLLPALLPLGTWPALLISGVIWGLWHSPLILLGYNFGYTDIRGVLLMVAGCVAWGALFGWARLRSGSVWPAVIGHGALNASGGLVMLISANAEEVNLAVVGPLGIVSWAVIAVIIVGMVSFGAFSQQPELAEAGGTAQTISTHLGPWQRFALALAEPVAQENITLTSREARKILKFEWGVTTQIQAQDRIQHSLDSVAYRVVLRAISSGETYDEFYQRLSPLAPSPQSLSFLANAFSVELGHSGVNVEKEATIALAWDIAVSLTFAEKTRAAGYTDEQYAHTTTDVLSLAAALSFSGWQEYGEALSAQNASIQWFAHDSESPWRQVEWPVAGKRLT